MFERVLESRHMLPRGKQNEKKKKGVEEPVSPLAVRGYVSIGFTITMERSEYLEKK